MSNDLDVLYEMATGYMLAELLDEHPERYGAIIGQARQKCQSTNNVRYSVDAMLGELIGGNIEELPSA